MKKKLISLAVVVCLLAVAVVGGTLAFFTDEDVVTNTFTAGKVEITLDEAKVDEYGVAVDPPARVTENTYKLYPGKEYVKDPTITVAADSEDCYLFVKVVNGLADLEAADNTIAAQMEAKGWTPVTGATDVYMQTNTYSAGGSVVVFDSFKIDSSLEADDLANVPNVVVTAYAVQAEGFASAQDAWDAAFGDPVAP